MRRFLKYYLPPILYGILIFTLSSMSKPPISLNFDSNLLHYPEYAIFSLLVARAILKDEFSILKRAVILSFLISLVMGFVDEVHQAFVPRRLPDVSDLIHDGIGAFLGLCIFSLYILFIRKFRKKGDGR